MSLLLLFNQPPTETPPTVSGGQVSRRTKRPLPYAPLRPFAVVAPANDDDDALALILALL